MNTTPQLHVLRVFCDERGHNGNPLGVFLGGAIVPDTDRQEIARELGFSETVFVEDRLSGALKIFTPTRELGFAGHPLVGTAWLVGTGGQRPSVLRPPAGAVRYLLEERLTWIWARPDYSPNWDLFALSDPGAVLALDGPPENLGHVQTWAWQDEPAGLVRARVFASDYGVMEDPATGSAAIVLCAEIGRELRIIQGPAGAESEILVRPLDDGWVKLGGRVIADRPASPFSR